MAGLLAAASAVGGVLATVWWTRESERAPMPAAPPAVAAAQEAVVGHDAEEVPQPRHTMDLRDLDGNPVGACLMLRAGPGSAVHGFFPLSHLPKRGDLTATDGSRLRISVHGVAEAYGFVLMQGLPDDGTAALRPRREPISTDAELRLDTDGSPRRVLGRATHNANELLLDASCPDGSVLLDASGDAAALTLGSTRALAVTPAWSWLETPRPGETLEAAQAQLRRRDPETLLEDVLRELAEVQSVEATRAALGRLDTGFAMARTPELVLAYDRALRHGHRLLAKRLDDAGDPRAAFEQARQALVRFPGDVDVLADAVVLAAGAGEFQAAADLWLELRSRDASRSADHAGGLGDALMRAAAERVDRAPRDAVGLLARGVELFPDRADLRMSYAGALLQAGDGASALWQARIAADRDPSLRTRLDAIAARTTTSGSAVEIPLDPDTHVVRAACAVAGRQLELMVDTGASITVLPTSFADAGKRTGRRVRIQTASGEVEAELVRFGELQIGSISVNHVTAAVMDLPGSLAGKGLLGMNVLRRLSIQLDSARDVLVLRR
ncbi:MAG: retropepsin-like aspartic protease [Planctomycetota bacterium]